MAYADETNHKMKKRKKKMKLTKVRSEREAEAAAKKMLNCMTLGRSLSQ